MIGYWVGQYLMWRFKSPLLLNALPHAQWKSFGAGGGRRCWWTRLRHSGRSCASRYHSDSGISSERRSPTIVSRQPFFGPCRGLVASSSPNNTCWGIRAASIRATWPSQRRRYSRRIVPMSSGRRALWAKSAVVRWRQCWSLLETPKNRTDAWAMKQIQAIHLPGLHGTPPPHTHTHTNTHTHTHTPWSWPCPLRRNDSALLFLHSESMSVCLMAFQVAASMEHAAASSSWRNFQTQCVLRLVSCNNTCCHPNNVLSTKQGLPKTNTKSS